MTGSAEDQLRELFAAGAAGAPPGEDLAAGALRRVRRTRRVRTAGAAALTAGAVALGAVLLPSDTEQQRPEAASSESAPDPTAEASTDANAGMADADSAGSVPRTGEVPSGVAADCDQDYSPQALAGLPFSFDGTVLGIEPARVDLLPEPGPWIPADMELANPYVAVTFDVEHWFAGGTGETVTVDIQGPSYGAEDSTVASYGVGTRMLVSGEQTEPFYLAYGCGFTRYWDEQTAAAWAAVTD